MKIASKIFLALAFIAGVTLSIYAFGAGDNFAGLLFVFATLGLATIVTTAASLSSGSTRMGEGLPELCRNCTLLKEVENKRFHPVQPCPECGSLKKCDHKVDNIAWYASGSYGQMTPLSAESRKHFERTLNAASKWASFWHGPEESIIPSGSYNVITREKDGTCRIHDESTIGIHLNDRVVVWAYVSDLPEIPKAPTLERWEDVLKGNVLSIAGVEDLCLVRDYEAQACTLLIKGYHLADIGEIEDVIDRIAPIGVDIKIKAWKESKNDSKQ